ncbi:MAG: two-component regulator propeller domain-containing protein, partial [Bacteroidota bacterium]
MSSFTQNYNIKHYIVQDGLLHAFVNDIIQDSRGNIWIATGGGLCKFNGVEFKSYTTKNGLNFPRLLCLAEDNFNNIWIGTSVGLNVFDGDSVYGVLDDQIKENILALEKSLDGQIWVSSDKGVKKVQFRDGEFYSEKLQYDFGKIEETNIFQDRNWNSFLIETNQHQLFIGLNNSIYIYHNDKVDKIEIDKSLQVYSACKLANNKIVFGTNNGLYSFQNNKIKRIKNDRLEGFKVFKIKRKEDKLWMIGKWGNEETDELFLVCINLNDKNYYK